MVNNDLSVGGGLNVGPGGALIEGELAVFGDQNNYILGGLSLGQVASSSSETVYPTHQLDVHGEGRFRVNDYHNLVLRSPNAGGDEDAYIDFISSNQTTVLTPTARIEFDAADPFTQTTSIKFHTQGPDDATMVSRLKISPEGHVLPELGSTYTLGDPNYRWQIVYTQDGVDQISDGRYKENVVKLGGGLGKVTSLRPVTFNWVESPDDGMHYGFIAQEVRQVLPEVVTGAEGENEVLSMNYTELVPVLVSAVQEQQEQIESQDQRIADLEARLGALEGAQGGRGAGWLGGANAFWLGGFAIFAALSLAGRRLPRSRA
jgi:hypothetical protein